MRLYDDRVSSEARNDIVQLYQFLIDADTAAADRALHAIEEGFDVLRKFPFTCRKAANGKLGPRWRELVISFGASGYVVLFEIENHSTVTISAVRHLREDDYY